MSFETHSNLVFFSNRRESLLSGAKIAEKEIHQNNFFSWFLKHSWQFGMACTFEVHSCSIPTKLIKARGKK